MSAQLITHYFIDQGNCGPLLSKTELLGECTGMVVMMLHALSESLFSGFCPWEVVSVAQVFKSLPPPRETRLSSSNSQFELGLFLNSVAVWNMKQQMRIIFVSLHQPPFLYVVSMQKKNEILLEMSFEQAWMMTNTKISRVWKKQLMCNTFHWMHDLSLSRSLDRDRKNLFHSICICKWKAKNIFLHDTYWNTGIQYLFLESILQVIVFYCNWNVTQQIYENKISFNCSFSTLTYFSNGHDCQDKHTKTSLEFVPSMLHASSFLYSLCSACVLIFPNTNLN